MKDMDEATLTELRRLIAELVGKCTLGLQNYELGLKRFLATSEISVSGGNDFSTNLEERRQRYSSMTLGQLIKDFTGNHLSSDPFEDLEDEEHGHDGAEIPTSFQAEFQFSTELSDEQYIELCENLRTLVKIRNELIHHFLSMHSLQDETGCLIAKQYLTETLELINHHTEKLNELFQMRAASIQSLREFMASDHMDHYLTLGYFPGQPINWSKTRAVELLKRAESQFKRSGWTELLPAIDWIKSQAPEVTPKAYDCSSWREVLHTSSLFEIRKQHQKDSPTKTFYRSR